MSHEWPSVELAELVTDGQISYGIVQPGAEATGGVPIVRVKDVRSGRIDVSSPLRVAEEISARHSKTVIRGGEVLVSLVGTVGEAAVANEALAGWNVARAIAVLRPLAGVAPEWLRLAFETQEIQRQIDGALNTTVQSTLNLADLKRLRIRMPPAEIRDGIAEVLGALDDKIAANTRLAATVEGLLRAEFGALEIDVEPGAGSSASVPLTDLFEVNPKRGKPADEEPVYVDMARLPTRSFSISDWTRRPARGGVRFTNGDTVMARITPCLENGKVGYIDFLEDAEIGIGSTEYIVLRSRVERGVPLPLSYFLARSPRFQANAVQHMVGTSGRQRLAADDIKPFLLGVPDVDALARFGRVADPLFAHVRSLTRENSVLAATRDTLLPQLMSGKLRVREAAEMAGL